MQYIQPNLRTDPEDTDPAAILCERFGYFVDCDNVMLCEFAEWCAESGIAFYDLDEEQYAERLPEPLPQRAAFQFGAFVYNTDPVDRWCEFILFTSKDDAGKFWLAFGGIR